MSTMWKQASGTALGVLIGLVMGAMMYARAAPKQQPVPEVIRAQKFELVDAQGNVAASLQISEAENKELGSKGRAAMLILTSPNYAHIVTNGDRSQAPGTGSMVMLTAMDVGASGLMMMGGKSNAQNPKSGLIRTAYLGMMGHDLIPTLKLSNDGDDKKVRIIKP